MSYIKLNKLNEQESLDLTSEILNMTVGEMLGKAASMDTDGDAEYEIIEDALRAISDKLGDSYEKSDDNDDVNFSAGDSVERPTDDDKDNFSDDGDINDSNDKDMPTYDDIAGSSAGGQQGIDNFNF